MTSSTFSFQNPKYTATIEDFISCKSDSDVCYNNLSFIDQNNNIQYCTYNVASDYLDEIRDNYCVSVELTDNELMKYKYRPKLLANDIYGNGELYFLILMINDMYDVKQFTKKNLLLPTKDNMSNIIKWMYNANKESISVYNEKNKS